jgi:hypothetical protein
MQLTQVLDIIEGLLRASEHPDIAAIERYGTLGAPWNPKDLSPNGSITGVRVTYQATSTAMLYGSLRTGEKAIPVPDTMPSPKEARVQRLPIFVAQLLNFAQPPEFRSWQLVAFPGIGTTGQQGTAPAGVSIQCADGTKMLLQSQATGAMVGTDPDEEPFPDYVIPEGVKSWQAYVPA